MPPLFPEGMSPSRSEGFTSPDAKRIESDQAPSQTLACLQRAGGDTGADFLKRRRVVAKGWADRLSYAENRGGRDAAARKYGVIGQVKPLPDGFRRTRQ